MSSRNGSPSDGIALEMHEVTARRGGTTVLDGFNLSVSPGAAIGIVGPNGSGKTTVLDVISGLVIPDPGEIRFDGLGVSSWSPQQRRRFGVRRIFQESRLYPQMTATEASRVATRSRTDTRDQVSTVFSPETTYVSELSTGQRRLLDLTAATAGTARLLLLDEPAAGVAPHERSLLVELLRAWRSRTNGTLVIVEHDRELLEAVVDEVVVIDERTRRTAHVNGTAIGDRDGGVDVGEILEQLASTKKPVSVPRSPGPSVWALARFGLREFAAGMLSVLTLGVLNRIMKVDLGIPLLVVAPILAAYNLAAPLALWIGARSDRNPIRGLHRTPYVIGGSMLMAAMAVLAPFVAWRLSADVGVITVLSGVLLFASMGAGMYGSGATYFALLSEVVSIGRERAVAVVYSMLMAGILFGVGLSAYVLPAYDPRALLSLHGFVAVLIVVCTWWAVRGAEGRDAPIAAGPTIGLRALVASSQVKRFFVFMVGLTFFAFLQQAILEPYGGDVFDLSVRATTSFNAVQIIGVLLGMIAAVRVVVPRIGRRGTTAAGCVLAAIGLFSIAFSGLGGSHLMLYSGIAAMGLGFGLLNVGSLSLMLDMTAGHAAGLAMGLWTVAHALADGAATASGGVLQSIARYVLDADAPAYAAVFGFEAVGLVAILALLMRVDPKRFKEEFETALTSEGGT